MEMARVAFKTDLDYSLGLLPIPRTFLLIFLLEAKLVSHSYDSENFSFYMKRVSFHLNLQVESGFLRSPPI